MYLAVDIGGTKVLLAAFTNDGKLAESLRFPTPESYPDCIKQLKEELPKLGDHDFKAAGVAIPGKVDRVEGRGLAFGRLPWENVPIEHDVERIINAPVVIENDANLAGLSEAILLKNEYSKVLYVTFSTGIGTGIIIKGIIDPSFADSEGGEIMIEYHDRLQKWEDVVSGRAIVKEFGKQAREITSETTWKHISRYMALGLIDLTALLQPEVIVIGGGVGSHFDRFGHLLQKELERYETPLIPLPVLRKAKRPEEAVIYGCYELVRSRYG